MKKIKWTTQQQQAISHRGSNILVTASAGTGKTAVLSGRCVDILSDKKSRPDVWSMLVLTFTDAAAEQMRNKIAEQLRAAYADTKDTHLREQLILLQGADISTIHSFCKRLITEHFYKLDIDPTFGIIDADEQQLLKADVLGQTIDWAWEQGIPEDDLKELLNKRNIGKGEDFLNTVIHISDFLETIEWPQEWLKRILAIADIDEFSAGTARNKQIQLVTKGFNDSINSVRSCINVYRNISNDSEWETKITESCIKPLEIMAKLAQQGKLNELILTLKQCDKPRINSSKKLDNKNIAELLRSTVKQAIDDIEKLSELAIFNPNYSQDIGLSACRQTTVLIKLVKKFQQLYSHAKKQLNRMDFSDLEKHTLSLLMDDSSCENSLVPSETAKTLQNKYKYIFVDEYQDINHVQKAILDLISYKAGIFVVGDVKQSIYAFRGAQPDIFSKDLEQIKHSAEQGTVRVDLNNNFRSAQGILDFVNVIFAQIMKKDIARIDYDETARLIRALGQGRQITEIKGKRVELHILDEKLGEKDNEEIDESITEEQDASGITTARQRQAAMIAQRIKQIVGADTGKAEFEIYDGDSEHNRPVEYRDIVILMRSVAMRANDYVEILQLAGIPVICDAAAGYFETTEIRDCLCLLKVLDNPLRDIELAAVLRGPVFKISDSELLKIRLFAKNDDKCKNFFDCIVRYSKTGTEQLLSDKLKIVLSTIEKWRHIAKYEKFSDLIWHIYSEKNLLAFYSAMSNGRNRKANLLKLHERAIQFEGFASNIGVVSLDRFVAFIEKLQESGTEWSAAEPQDTASNAVRIMSVHKSKGLEFPVVFLAEMDSRFNTKDEHQQVLMSNEDGLGLEIIDPKTNVKSESATHQIIAAHQRKENLAEEMRILYVAMTRAKDKLILTACRNSENCSDILAKGFFFGSESNAVTQLANYRRMIDWIIFGLSDYDFMHKAFETGLDATIKNDGLFDLFLYQHNKLKQFSEYIGRIHKKKNAVDVPVEFLQKYNVTDFFEIIKQSLSQTYKYSLAASLPSKQSVTDLTHSNDEFAILNYSRALSRLPFAIMSNKSGLAKSAESRDVGTATHAVIANLDLSKPVNSKSIDNAIESLVRQGNISSETAKHIKTGAIQAFFNSELGKLALDKNNLVKREWPFTYAMDAGNNEQTTIQGIIDMLIKTPDGLIIIDFKTDRLTKNQLQNRVDIYRRQLQLYDKAAQSILRSKVQSVWLYFLEVGTAIEI